MADVLTAPLDDRSVTALDEGSGPTLLIVHPGSSDAASWDEVTGLLTDDFRVVRIRRRIYLPGADLSPHTMAAEAADVLAIAALLTPPVLLVGHSSGAVAALEAALRSPSAFAGMVLYEPPLPTRSLLAGEASTRAHRALDAGDPVEAIRIHLRDIVRMPEWEVDALLDNPGARQLFAQRAAAQLADNDTIDALGVGTDRFAALDLPTTLIEGDRSPAHLRERVNDLASALPDARTVTLPGQAHIAHLTAPALLATAIREAAAPARGR